MVTVVVPMVITPDFVREGSRTDDERTPTTVTIVGTKGSSFRYHVNGHGTPPQRNK